MPGSPRTRRTAWVMSLWLMPPVSRYTGMMRPVTRPISASGSNIGLVKAKVRPVTCTLP